MFKWFGAAVWGEDFVGLVGEGKIALIGQQRMGELVPHGLIAAFSDDDGFSDAVLHSAAIG